MEQTSDPIVLTGEEIQKFAKDLESSYRKPGTPKPDLTGVTKVTGHVADYHEHHPNQPGEFVGHHAGRAWFAEREGIPK
jgi:hypothetical protein